MCVVSACVRVVFLRCPPVCEWHPLHSPTRVHAHARTHTLGPTRPQADTERIDEVMACAAKTRSVARTDMNAESSRSHSIFTLHLTATNSRIGSVLHGQLNLVDLAGSEAVYEVQGRRPEERETEEGKTIEEEGTEGTEGR